MSCVRESLTYSSDVGQSSIPGEEVSIAGRIHTMRASGEKLRFYDLYADGQKIQVLANAK